MRQAAVRERRSINLAPGQIYSIDTMHEAFFRLERDAAPGVDGETWRGYREDLESNLQCLSERIAKGAHRASPVQRAYIPTPTAGGAR
jgi:RNA-directed DNA polymerase